jgi:WD40 repeat protein
MEIFMKIHKNALILRLGTAIGLLSMLFSTPITAMVVKYTPQQKRIISAGIASMRNKIVPSIWVQTNDDEMTEIALRKINQMTELSRLLSFQKSKNSKNNPIKATMLTKNELMLLSTALDQIAAGAFDEYYQSLVPEYNKSLTDKNIGPGALRTLIAAAGKVKAAELTAFLSSYFLPNDILRHEMIPQFINPIIPYLTSKIAAQDKLYSTILAGHPDTITNCEFSKDGSILVTSSKGAIDNLIIWNGQTGAKLKTISVSHENGDIEVVKPSPDGSKVVICTTKKINKPENNEENNNEKNTLILLDTKTGKEIKILNIAENIISTHAQFNSDGTRIVIGAQAQKIIVEDINAPEEKTFIYVIDSSTGTTIAKHEIINNEPDAELSPHGNTMIIRSGEHLSLYDITTGKIIKQLEEPTEKFYFVKYSTDGTKIITYSDPRDNHPIETVFIWNGNTGDKIAQLSNLNANSAAINSDGTKIITAASILNANQRLPIYIWNIATQTQIDTIESTLSSIQDLAFSPDNSMILASGNGWTGVEIYNAITKEIIHTFHLPNNPDATFNSDGTRIKVNYFYQIEWNENDEAITKNRIVFYDVATGKEIKAFIEQYDLVESTPDFLNIVSPDPNNNHNFILWTSFTPEERATLQTIENSLNIQQAHFLYQLYIATLSKSPRAFTENKQFLTLPDNVQDMVKQYLNPAEKPIPQAVKTGPVAMPIINREPVEAVQEEVVPVRKTWWQWLTGQ